MFWIHPPEVSMLSVISHWTFLMFSNGCPLRLYFGTMNDRGRTWKGLLVGTSPRGSYCWFQKTRAIARKSKSCFLIFVSNLSVFLLTSCLTCAVIRPMHLQRGSGKPLISTLLHWRLTARLMTHTHIYIYMYICIICINLSTFV